jgi:hypothetical protein
VQKPAAPLDKPAAAVAFRRRVMSRARDVGAPRTARLCCGPRKPGPARVRAHQRREAEPCPCLAVPLLDYAVPHAVPRRNPTTALPCAVTTRCGRDIAFMSRPSPSGIPSNTHTTHATRTRGHTHTGPPWVEPHRIWRSHQIRWETDKRAPQSGKRGALPLGPFCQRERERERGGEWWLWAGLLS